MYLYNEINDIYVYVNIINFLFVLIARFINIF